MRFADIKGNEPVKAALAGMIDTGRIPHAIMFHEDDGGGAIAFCTAFLQLLFCSSAQDHDSCGACPSCNKISKFIHPDVSFVFPVTGGSIIPSSAKPTSLSYISQWRDLVLSNPFFTENDLNEALGIQDKSAVIAVQEARNILETLSFNSLEGGYRAVVIYLPEKMNQESANRLLKTVEEPPEKTQLLLITHSPEKVLRTISSRCQTIRIAPVERENLSEGPDAEEFHSLCDRMLSAIADRNLLDVLECGEVLTAFSSREKTKSFYKYLSDMLRDIFLVQQGMKTSSDETVSRLSARLKKNFPRLAMQHIDEAANYTERNVNQKIISCSLTNKLMCI